MMGTPPTKLKKCKTAYWRIHHTRCQAQLINDMKKVKQNQKCPLDEKINITSQKCQKCKNYIKHDFVCDDHGRIEYYMVDCKVLNCA